MKHFLRPFGALVSGVLLAMCFVPFDQSWLVWGWMWILLPLLWTVSPGNPISEGEGRKIIKIFIRLVKLRSSRAF
ncbi:MAG: hypothetical protein ACPGAP_06650, partial [Akkermansiaceae bacterium]